MKTLAQNPLTLLRWGLLVAMVVIFSLANGYFLAPGNIYAMGETFSLLGLVALTGGVGRPFGIAIGVLVLAVLNNGLGLIGASSPTILLLNGGVLLVAVLFGGAPGAWLRARA